MVDGESSDEEPSADEAVSVTPRGRGKTERYKQAQKTAQDRRKQRKKRRRLEEAAKQKRDPSNKDADITAAAEERRKKKKMEKRQKEAEQQDLLDDEEKKVKKAKNVKQYTTNILKLNNNKLMDLDNLVPHLSALVMQPDMIVWLDLSFNSLDDIDPVSMQRYMHTCVNTHAYTRTPAHTHPHTRARAHTYTNTQTHTHTHTHINTYTQLSVVMDGKKGGQFTVG